MSFEESLIRHASPTLANIKMANLYNFRFSSLSECRMTITESNAVMNSKGIYADLLKHDGDFYLVYVYRKSSLGKLLQNEDIILFLREMGYPATDSPEKCLDFLKHRLAENPDFPHEIGIFLGYPLCDVKAFIEKKGQNFLVSGEWKAYHDKENALHLFSKYNHCKESYINCYTHGRKFRDMLVTA